MRICYPSFSALMMDFTAPTSEEPLSIPIVAAFFDQIPNAVFHQFRFCHKSQEMPSAESEGQQDDIRISRMVGTDQRGPVRQPFFVQSLCPVKQAEYRIKQPEIKMVKPLSF
jgi:hypothetical protein